MITISSTDIINAACSNEGKDCDVCGADASGGNNKIQYTTGKVLCAPCGDSYLEEERQRLLKMIKSGDLS